MVTSIKRLLDNNGYLMLYARGEFGGTCDKSEDK